MEDVANWALCKEVPDEKCGALVLSRGLRTCLMDLVKKLTRGELRHADELKFLSDLLEKEIGSSDMRMKVRRFAELVRDRRKEGMPMESFMAASEAKPREIKRDAFIQATEQLAGTLLIIKLELTHQELSNLMTAIDARKGYDAFNLQKVMDAVRRVVVPPQGWGGGKPGSSQWVCYGTDWGSQEWNWDNEWVTWAGESTTLTGNEAECWDAAYDAHLEVSGLGTLGWRMPEISSHRREMGVERKRQGTRE